MLKEEPCTGCGAAIMQVPHVRTEKPAPITVATHANGNILVEDGHYRIIPAAQRADYAGRLRLNHFADCPKAEQFGRKAQATR